MKLKSILCNELLASSRYCDGTDGHLLLEKYSDVVYDTFDTWKSLGSIWGCTELSSGLCALFAYAASRKCSRKLAIEILYRLHFPNLQCAALAYVKEPEDMCYLADELSNDKRDTVSVFLSIMEAWNWRLNRIADRAADKEKWIKEDAPDHICNMYSIVLKSGNAKLFIRWLFSKGYRNWTDVRGEQSVEKQLHYLMEGAIVASWNPSLIDTEINDIDYLSFLATDIDENHPLSPSDVNKVMDGYVRLFDNLDMHDMSIPLSMNTLNRLCGFSEIYWKEKNSDLLKEVNTWIEKCVCIFEGWKVKGKMHDYRHIQRESFILSALLEMCVHRVKDVAERSQICNTIVNHLFRQQNCSDDLFIEYYSAPFCIARQAVETISAKDLDAFDEKLIMSHRSMECVLNILNCSCKTSLSLANKKLLKDRWTYEYKAWEGRMMTTSQKPNYDYMVRLANAFTKP